MVTVVSSAWIVGLGVFLWTHYASRSHAATVFWNTFHGAIAVAIGSVGALQTSSFRSGVANAITPVASDMPGSVGLGAALVLLFMVAAPPWAATERPSQLLSYTLRRRWFLWAAGALALLALTGAVWVAAALLPLLLVVAAGGFHAHLSGPPALGSRGLLVGVAVATLAALLQPGPSVFWTFAVVTMTSAVIERVASTPRLVAIVATAPLVALALVFHWALGGVIVLFFGYRLVDGELIQPLARGIRAAEEAELAVAKRAQLFHTS